MLHVITGPMFSGKTEELIRLLRRHAIAGHSTMVYRPALDTRSTILESRSGYTFPATHTRNATSLLIDAKRFGPEVIAIDEAQFFDNLLPHTVRQLLDRHVIVSGLDKTFRGDPFGPMPELLALADTVTKLTAVCTVCGSDATMTQRTIDSRDTIVIGGLNDDSYEARCREHHEI